MNVRSAAPAQREARAGAWSSGAHTATGLDAGARAPAHAATGLDAGARAPAHAATGLDAGARAPAHPAPPVTGRRRQEPPPSPLATDGPALQQALGQAVSAIGQFLRLLLQLLGHAASSAWRAGVRAVVLTPPARPAPPRPGPQQLLPGPTRQTAQLTPAPYLRALGRPQPGHSRALSHALSARKRPAPQPDSATQRYHLSDGNRPRVRRRERTRESSGGAPQQLSCVPAGAVPTGAVPAGAVPAGAVALAATASLAEVVRLRAMRMKVTSEWGHADVEGQVLAHRYGVQLNVWSYDPQQGYVLQHSFGAPQRGRCDVAYLHNCHYCALLPNAAVQAAPQLVAQDAPATGAHDVPSHLPVDAFTAVDVAARGDCLFLAFACAANVGGFGQALLVALAEHRQSHSPAALAGLRARLVAPPAWREVLRDHVLGRNGHAPIAIPSGNSDEGFALALEAALAAELRGQAVASLPVLAKESWLPTLLDHEMEAFLGEPGPRQSQSPFTSRSTSASQDQ